MFLNAMKYFLYLLYVYHEYCNQYCGSCVSSNVDTYWISYAHSPLFHPKMAVGFG